MRSRLAAASTAGFVSRSLKLHGCTHLPGGTSSRIGNDIFQHPGSSRVTRVTKHRLLRSNPANPELRFDLIKPYLRFVEPERRYFDADTACFKLFSFGSLNNPVNNQ
ncbi:hypothetical protein TNCV_304511 [Trichonephila clavipes]|nr:hypothetical protein TNCV_304511 [Trichonephila clavipes]